MSFFDVYGNDSENHIVDIVLCDEKAPGGQNIWMGVKLSTREGQITPDELKTTTLDSLLRNKLTTEICCLDTCTNNDKLVL